VFDIYDFDGDGQISREDARIILSYIPQVSQTIKELERSFEPEDKIRKKMFESRIMAQEQIEELCDAVFKEGDENITRDIRSFMSIVEKECSDLLVSILTVIRDCLP
jgi:Ca2+-binding EF-hand superfamily protein